MMMCPACRGHGSAYDGQAGYYEFYCNTCDGTGMVEAEEARNLVRTLALNRAREKAERDWHETDLVSRKEWVTLREIIHNCC